MIKVYQHRRRDTNEIFYVGRGVNRRPWEIISGRTAEWKEIYKSVGRTVEILKTFDNVQEAADFETELIAQYRSQGIPLVNKKDGGFDRNQGFPHSDETKQKISKRLLINNASRKAVKTPLGIFVSKVEAAKVHNVHWDTIGYRIKHHEGYELCLIQNGTHTKNC